MIPDEIKEDIEKLAGFFWGIVGCLAICCALAIKGITWENVFDAIKDIAGLAAVIVAVIAAIRASKRTVTLDMVAEKALQKLQLKHNTLLSGPAFNSSTFSPDPEKKTARMRYLFLVNQKKNAKLRMSKIALIPVDILAEGILDIRISKATLANLDTGPVTQDLIKQRQDEVHKAVRNVLDRLVPNQFSAIHPIPDTELGDEGEEGEKASPSRRFENSACVYALDTDMSHRLFSKVVYACAEKALETLTSFK